MRLPSLPSALLALAAVVDAATLEQRDLIQDLQKRAIDALQETKSSRRPGYATGRDACSLRNAAVRKDWEYMKSDERKAYISAVQCLLSKPSTSDPELVPGAKTRYDDFVAQHINQTLSIHGTGNFLSWHRYFVHGYEKALKDECGYNGTQPYWNWFAYQDRLRESPVFDGSSTSMSGDGSFVKHNGSVGGTGKIFLPSGQGGGCIESGPFKNLQTNLGPVSPTMDGETKVPSNLAYNPRCLKRDLTPYASSTWLTDANLHNITLGAASASVLTFQNELQGRFNDGFLGLHAAGHFTIGGDAGDVYSSPNDPAFFLHHAMLDRVWWIWQALHADQAKTVGGTITIFNNPPSRNATLEDLVQFNYLGVEPRKIGDLLDSLSGDPFCYIYS